MQHVCIKFKYYNICVSILYTPTRVETMDDNNQIRFKWILMIVNLFFNQITTFHKTNKDCLLLSIYYCHVKFAFSHNALNCVQYDVKKKNIKSSFGKCTKVAE